MSWRSVAIATTSSCRLSFVLQPVVGTTKAPPSPTEVTHSAAAPVTAPTSAAKISAEALRFTHPAEIANPFYPISLIGQAISLGTNGGKPARTEVTLLPDTKMISWDGQQTETRVSQLLGAHDHLVEAMGAKIPVFWDRSIRQPLLAQLNMAVDESTFKAAWNAGQALSFEQALDYALNEEVVN